MYIKIHDEVITIKTSGNNRLELTWTTLSEIEEAINLIRRIEAKKRFTEILIRD